MTIAVILLYRLLITFISDLGVVETVVEEVEEEGAMVLERAIGYVHGATTLILPGVLNVTDVTTQEVSLRKSIRHEYVLHTIRLDTCCYRWIICNTLRVVTTRPL